MQHKGKTVVVGQGIAGTYVSYALHKRGIDHLVVDPEESGTSSEVAAGICNPITGKRVTLTWQASALFDYAHSFYPEFESFLGASFFEPRPIYRVFPDVAYQNDFEGRSSDEEFKPFLDRHLAPTEILTGIKGELGGSGILHGGWCNTWAMVAAYRHHLKKTGTFFSEAFAFEDLFFDQAGLRWKGSPIDRIIFCEGPAGRFNPLFRWLPFSVTKGELLKLDIPNFDTPFIVNKGFFLFRLPDGSYLSGSTFSHDLAEGSTEKMQARLLEKLDTLLKVPFKILSQPTGIRPTIRDRRPLVGAHPSIEGVFIFNGLGTKGVTLGPYFANQFVEYLFNGKDLHPEVNIQRFSALFEKTKA